MKLRNDTTNDSVLDAHARRVRTFTLVRPTWSLTSSPIAFILAVELCFNAREPAIPDHDVIDIAELGRRTGTAPSALRYYERLGLLAPTGRSGGRRQYASGAAERVAMIRLCQDGGFTLAEIAELLRTIAGRKTVWARFAQAKVDEIKQRIAEVQRAKALLQHALSCPAPNLLA